MENLIGQMPHFTDERAWFHRKRFGIFLHWGIYAVHGIHEQEQWRISVPAPEYEKLRHVFNPVRFDPAEWLDFFQGAGFEYLVFTSKHHDGFCMWNTRETDYNIMNTPYGKDVIGMLAEECHKRKFPLELYYSCVDWHHPAYPNLGRHHEITTDPAKHDMAAYMEFLKTQVRELCTNYAPIHGIWWDMNVPQLLDRSVNDMIRSLSPLTIINGRGYDEGDYATPEREYDPENANPDKSPAFTRITEACQSISPNSWGYCADDDYFHPDYFMKQMDLNGARGGNYLLNMGPAPDGTLPDGQKAVVSSIGKWLNAVRESFPENGQTGMLENGKLLTVRDGRTLFVHCPYSLDCSMLSLKPITEVPERVTLLNTGKPVDFTMDETIYGWKQGRYLRLRNIPNVPVPVFRIDFPA